MRVPINIASRPANTSRPLRSSAIVLGCVVVMLGFLAVRSELRSRNEFRALVDRNNQLQSEIQELKGAQKEMQDWLETPQVTQIRRRSAQLNALISQKSLSWTRMFQDLETILPGGVRITGIAPEPARPGASANEPVLRLAVSAAATAPIVEFIKRLEDSPQFANPVVGGQQYPPEGDEAGEIKVALLVRYVQIMTGGAEQPENPAAEEDEDGGEASPLAGAAPRPPEPGLVATGRRETPGAGRRP